MQNTQIYLLLLMLGTSPVPALGLGGELRLVPGAPHSHHRPHDVHLLLDVVRRNLSKAWNLANRFSSLSDRLVC